MLDLLAVQSGTANATLITLAYTLILTFILSSVIAWTYEKTFLGLSYSRNFVQAIVLSAVVAATVMQAIGDNVGRGLGMMGALSVVRCRYRMRRVRLGCCRRWNHCVQRSRILAFPYRSWNQALL